jgi:imidazolonepropionase
VALPRGLDHTGLVDCHTHVVYAGSRAGEFERRLHGATYADIAREGGGILATVRATRAATEDELCAVSQPRVAALAAEGVTTIEIKSGYGLDTASELKQLAAARRVGAALDVDVRTTLLAAHALPPEFSGRAGDYIDYVCNDTIPAAAASGLADAVDAFCETIGFSPEETRRVFDAARRHGLAVKLHADQLSDQGGAALAAGTARCRPIISSTPTRPVWRRWRVRIPSRSCYPVPTTRCARRGCLRSPSCARSGCRSQSRPTAIRGRRR